MASLLKMCMVHAPGKEKKTVTFLKFFQNSISERHNLDPLFLSELCIQFKYNSKGRGGS